MRIVNNLIAFGATFSLAACTLITDANDRKVIDGPTDLDFTFKNMGVHGSSVLDVAIVTEDDVLQGRARIVMPPKASDYPDVSVKLEKALPPGKNRLFFYVDSDPENNLVDSRPNAITEHIWIEDVPATGTGSFTHSTNFMLFSEDDYQSLNADLVFDLPMVPETPRARACIAKLLDDAIKESLELHVLVTVDQHEVAYFKTFKGNGLPTSIRLPGVIDAPNEYRINVVIDGEQRNSINLEAAMGEKDFVVPAARWFPAANAAILQCRNLTGP